MKQTTGNSALRALTSSALALGGIAGNAAADSPIDRYQADYNWSTYNENDLPDNKGLPGGQRSRYEIEMQQVTLDAPIGERMDVGLELTYETMSGASPYYVLPDAAGAPVQVMSAASIREERKDIGVQLNRYYDNARMGFASGYSTENDYDSMSFSMDGETHFNENNTTLSSGLGVSLDTIEPTDGGIGTRPDNEEKRSYSFVAGLSQVLGQRSTAQTSLTFKRNTGYLSDPYKQIFIFGGTFLPDTRPDARNQLTWLTRYRHHVEELNGSFHADYSFYLDDWGITAHTFELAWHQSLGEHVRLVPSVRYYTQSEADFYSLFFPITPGGDGSSDYRLSAYGALTVGMKGEWIFRTPLTGGLDWRAVLSWDRYISSGDLAFAKVDVENPGLVSYNVLTLGFGLKY